jgi:formamidopyrimidine-DNA glycosylase
VPELPEVTTTVAGLNAVLPKLSITDVWTDYFLSTKHKRTDNIKNKNFFEKFKTEVIGEKVKNAERRGKNILIHLSGGKTILIHMKMTGHLLYGKYEWNGKVWKSSEKFLSDRLNQFIHLTFTLSDGKYLAFSDMRKFAKVTLFETDKRDMITDLALLGPEPLQNFSSKQFSKQLDIRPEGKIKTVLLDQTIVAGIGNIYSDEILWQTGIHPERKVKTIPLEKREEMWKAMKKILTTAIRMGGDSMGDYHNVYGRRGSFHDIRKVYRRTKQKCLKKGCAGTILRKVVGGRSAHFCNVHQK